MRPSRILLVEDSETDAAALTRFLTRGLDGLYVIAHADRCESGLTMAAEFAPDVILLDYDLPDCTGLEFLEALHERFGETAPIVLAITGQANPRIAADLIVHGALDYLAKSEMSEESVRLAVRQAIRTRALRDDLSDRTRERERSQADLVASLERASYLAKVSDVLMRTLDVRSVLETIARLSLPQLGDACFVDLAEGPMLVRHSVAMSDAMRERAGTIAFMRAPFLDAGEGAPRAMRTMEGISYEADWLPAVARWDAVIAELVAAGSIAALIAVPLVFDGQAMGALSFISIEPYDAYAQNVAEEIGRRASAALANARAFERQRAAITSSEAARRRMHVVARISEVFTRSLEWREAFAAATDLLVPSFCDSVSIAIEDGALVTVAAAPAGSVVLGSLPPITTASAASAFANDATHATMTVAITGANGHRHGVMTFTAVGVRRFTLDDLALAEDLGRRAGMFMENARLFEREREIARGLQTSLLPLEIPSMAGVTIAAVCVAGVEGVDVGGDWYDVVRLPNGRIAFAVGDVAGRGVLAAAIMGQLRSSLRAYVLEGLEPGDALARLNIFMLSQERMTFATVGLGVIDAATGVLHYASAGHLPPLIRESDGTASFLETASALPVGLMNDAYYEQSEHRLAPDASITLFTDGLIESRARPIDAGLTQLLAVARRSHESPDAFVNELLVALAPGAPETSDDDVTALTLRFEPVADQGGFAPREPSLAVTYPAIASSAPEMRRRLTAFLKTIGFPAWEAGNVQLAAGEALANAIQHAYCGVAQPGLVTLRAASSGGRLRVEVRDHGVWRQKRRETGPALLAENGRGITLMHALCNEAIVERDGAGTRVRLMFAFGATASEPLDATAANGARS